MFLSRFTLLFVLCYIFLYIFPDVFNYIPGVSFITGFYMDFVKEATTYLGKEVLGLQDLVFQKNTGSGDTQFDYVRLLLIVIISTFVAAIGSFFPKWNLVKFRAWLTIYCRYYLGIMFIAYGLGKFQGQFSSPDFYALENRLGNMSPMGLLWNFMGYSAGYTFFTGAVEIIAGYLLLFRRTVVFGALLGVMAMAQVWILNMTFDVPVKINSFHYMLLCGFIVWPHLKSVYLFFFSGEAVALKTSVFLFKNDKFNKVKHWSKLVVMVLLTSGIGLVIFRSVKNRNIEDKSVGFISENKQGLNIFYENKDYGTVVWPNDSYGTYKVRLDSTNNQIIVADWKDSTLKYNVKYQRLSDTTVNLQGRVKEDSVSGLYAIKYKKDYLLNRRGFRWVSEFPFNR